MQVEKSMPWVLDQIARAITGQSSPLPTLPSPAMRERVARSAG
jgi:hypothetical protein